MKIGLFFGSFNPVHVGHMILANYMLEYTDIERILFVVSPHNPLKDKSTLLEKEHRLNMVNVAIGINEKILASDIEFNLEQPSYTITTLKYIKEQMPNDEFVIIIGEDISQTLHNWKGYEEIINNYEIYIYPRTTTKTVLYLKENKKVKYIKAPLVEISSTLVREAIKEGKDVRYFVPAGVWEHINKMGFYK